MSGKTISFAKLIGDGKLKKANKNLKPGEAPVTIDQLYAKNPAFLAMYKRGSGQSIGAPVVTNAGIANIDDVKKRLAAQLGGSTIIGGDPTKLGG